MATNLEIYNTAQSARLSARILGGLYKAASGIRAEDAGTENHANRLLWANQVMTEDIGGVMLKRFKILCAQNSTIAAAGDDATDNDIDYVIALYLNEQADGSYGA